MAEKSTLIKPPRFGARFWNAEIKAGQARSREFIQHSKDSILCYNTKYKFGNSNAGGDIQRRLNVWWYVVNTLIPAYFSSTPKVETELRKKAGNSIQELSCVVLERTTQYEMDECFNFDKVARGSALSFLLTGRAVLWARYEANIEKAVEEFALLKNEEGGILDADGNPYNEEVTEKEGRPYGSMEIEQVTNERAVLDNVHYDDYLTSDARDESEIFWRARAAYLSQEKATDLFGKDTADKLTYDSFPAELAKDRLEQRNVYEGKAKLWEVYCEESGKVYWAQAKGGKSILESGDPPVKFKDFYPCVEISQSIDPDSTIPVSDWVHCRDQVLEVERLNNRIHWTTEAIRTNAAYDATMTELEDILSGDLKMIPVKSWPAYKTRGGLASAIDTLAIDPYVKALQVLIESRERAKAQLYETMKASDLLRGASDPVKTATANRLESQWSSMGLVVRQEEFARFIGGAISKLGVTIAQKFSPEKIIASSDAENLVASVIDDGPDKQAQVMQTLQQMIATLKDDTELNYRISIASDSMVALDQQQERKDAADLLSSAGAFFQQMQSIIEQYPPLSQFSMELFQYMIRRYRGGKELEPLFLKAISDVSKISAQKQEMAQQQPPDPKVLESQTRIQVAQMEAQDSHQKNMLEMQRMQQDAIIEQQKSQMELEVKIKELELKARELDIELLKVQGDLAARQTDAAIADKQVNADAALESVRIEADKRAKELETFINQQKVEVDKLNAKVYAFEKINEETRLARVELGEKTVKAAPLL